MKKIKKFSMDGLEDLFDEASEVDGNASKEKQTESSALDDDYIHFEINEDDDILTTAAKGLINESKIKLQTVYDKKGRLDGYNMKYSIFAREQLGWKRVMDWCRILHKVPEISFRDMTEEEIAIAEEELLIEKNRPKKKRGRSKKS